ncbi:MAG: ROK family transcriptional regulator [Actinomycetota bacterium]
MKTYNAKLLKQRNQRLILRLLKVRGPLSRAELAKKIGIVRSTVSDITNKLLEENILIEGKKIKGNLGKRPTPLYFNKGYYHYAALIITPDDINIAICNLNGEIINTRYLKLVNGVSAKEILDIAFKNLDEMVQKDKKANLCLISLGSPETLNKNTGVIRWAPYIRDWVGLDLREIFKQKYGAEVIIREHVKLETLGEQWKGFNNISNMVYLVITKGIGAGVIIDGKIREGKNGYLGEVAFLPISDKLNYENIKGQNKNLGYFEAQCDVKKIEELARNYYEKKKEIKKFHNLNEIAQLYKKDLKFKALVNEKIIKTLALGISTIIVVLDPEIVVINGEVIELGDDFLEVLKKEVYSITPYRREIVFSKLKRQAGIYGAIKNGLNYIDKFIYENPNEFFKIQ